MNHPPLYISLAVLFTALVISVAYISSTRPESFVPARQTIVGQARRIRTGTLMRTIPNIVPLYKHPSTWIVNVPLVPFRAPLKPIQPLDALPPFLLYKQEYLSKIQDQGDCGCCFAFSVGHMLSDRLAITTLGRFNDNVSVQQMISCYDKSSCDGGSPEELCLWVAQNQFRINTVYKEPYVQKSGTAIETACRKLSGYRVGVEPGSVRSIVEFVPEEGFDPAIVASNVMRMKTELMTSGPFYCAMRVFDDLFTYSGMKPYVPGKKAIPIGGHAIEIIGYCDANTDPRIEFREAYWICRNSWGKSWPLKSALTGYFTVPMGRNVCGIESRCGSATPFLEGYVAPPGTATEMNKLRITDVSLYVI